MAAQKVAVSRTILVVIVAVILAASAVTGYAISTTHTINTTEISSHTVATTTTTSTAFSDSSSPLSTNSSSASETAASHSAVNCSAGSVPQSSANDWLTFKHDPERTGLASSNRRFQGKLAWQGNGTSVGFSELVAFDDRAFSAEYYLFATNVTNEHRLFNVTTGVGPAPNPSSDGSIVYMGSPANGFYGYTPSNGEVKSNGDLGLSLGSAAIYGDCIFVTSGYGFGGPPPGVTSSLYALNATTLGVLWSYNLTSSFFYETLSTDGTYLAAITNSGTLTFRISTTNHNYRTFATTTYTCINPKLEVTN